jgi:hypothetical protein
MQVARQELLEVIARLAVVVMQAAMAEQVVAAVAAEEQEIMVTVKVEQERMEHQQAQMQYLILQAVVETATTNLY